MTEQDFTRFVEWFDVLAVTHRLNAKPELRNKMRAEYFDVLRSYPVDAVQSAYETLRRKMKKWPVPADWLEALPPFGSVARLPALTADEQAQHDEAERLGYEAAHVCTCMSCVAANCAQPPRYVPLLDRDGQVIERRHPLRVGRPVLLGRWIHGRELRNWYSARAEFYAVKAKIDAQLEQERREKPSPEQRMHKLIDAAKALSAERVEGLDRNVRDKDKGAA